MAGDKSHESILHDGQKPAAQKQPVLNNHSPPWALMRASTASRLKTSRTFL